MARLQATWILSGTLVACGPSVLDGGAGMGGAPGATSGGSDPSTGGSTTAGPGPGSTTGPDTGGPSTSGPSTGGPSTSGPTDPGSSDSDDSATDNPFVVPPDAVCGCWCDPFAQDCAEGEKCSPVSIEPNGFYDHYRCVPVMPPALPPGAPCQMQEGTATGLDDCALGSFCAFVEPSTLQGTCVAMCTGSENRPVCAGDGYDCVSWGQELFVCIQSCNPLDEMPCPEGHVCTFGGGTDLPWCRPDDGTSSAQPGDPCGRGGSCGPLGCASEEVDPNCPHPGGCCSVWCDLEAPQCPRGTACTEAFPNAGLPPGWANVGMCV